ncbi:hypothetical protein KASHIRA_00100 [Serratia phage vB_SmaM-Kashira]|nr:hypothetical protein KASHIRA_00100 [Serratia phage vB_SmaM-Kashira]
MENKEISLEVLQENLRQDLKKLTRSQLIDVVIQSQMQVIHLGWELDSKQQENKRLLSANSRQPRGSFGGVSLS